MKKHRGSAMFMAVMFMFFATSTYAGLVSLTTAQRQTARSTASNGTKVYSLLAFSDLAVDAAIYDLMNISATVNLALVGNDSGVGIYDTALTLMQERLFQAHVGQKYPLYIVTNPADIVEYDGGALDDAPEMKTALHALIQDAELEIRLLDDVEIDVGNPANIMEFQDGDSAVLKDFRLSITLKKALSEVNQEYRVSGVTVHYKHSDYTVHANLEGSEIQKIRLEQDVNT